jgi:diguanylate cyclase (GGDEF)-like protein
MEIRNYLRIIARRWWIIVGTVIVFFAIGLIYVSRQPKVYESKSSFVLRPHSEIVLDYATISTIDTISRRIEIASTFAQVVGSNQIKSRALDRMGRSEDDSITLSANGSVVAGTNVLELTARGPDPVTVEEFADAVSVETVSFVNNLFDVFELQSLDEATVSNSPVSPRTTLILIVAVFAGVGIGIGTAFLVDYIIRSLKQPEPFEIVDIESGAYNQQYFLKRLGEELSRSVRQGYSLSVVLIEITSTGKSNPNNPEFEVEIQRKVIAMIGTQLQEEDVISRYAPEQLALLLPDRDGAEALDTLHDMRQLIEDFSKGASAEPDLTFTAGITSLDMDNQSQETLLREADDALSQAKISDELDVVLFGYHEVDHQESDDQEIEPEEPKIDAKVEREIELGEQQDTDIEVEQQMQSTNITS